MVLSAIIQIGFFMGLLGSIHCVGMCGPLVMALPLVDKQGFQKFLAIALYHIGKMGSYAMLGIIFGLLGSQFPMYLLPSSKSFFLDSNVPLGLTENS